MSTTTDVAAAAGPGHFQAAARETGLVWASLFALGVGFGVLVTDEGLPWWLAPMISGLVFAGSVEFLLIGMLALSAPIASVVATTLLVNSRHLFYGLAFPLHLVQGRWAKAYSIFALCDEAFALLCDADRRELSSRRILWTQAGLHVSWAVGALAGAVAGSALLTGVEGMDFLLTALFLVLAIDAYRARPDRVGLAMALGASVLAYILMPGSLLLVAMCVFVVLLAARHASGVRHA